MCHRYLKGDQKYCVLRRAQSIGKLNVDIYGTINTSDQQRFEKILKPWKTLISVLRTIYNFKAVQNGKHLNFGSGHGLRAHDFRLLWVNRIQADQPPRALILEIEQFSTTSNDAFSSKISPSGTGILERKFKLQSNYLFIYF